MIQMISQNENAIKCLLLTSEKWHLKQIFIHHEDSILSLARKSSPLADKFGESWGDLEPPTFFLSQPVKKKAI